MATQDPQWGKLAGVKAAADLSSRQFFFVKFTADNTVSCCTAITDVPCGVLQNTPKSGQAADVTAVGSTKLVGGVALTAGWLVSTSSAGKAIRMQAGTNTTAYTVGQVQTGTAGADEYATVVIDCSAPGRGA